MGTPATAPNSMNGDQVFALVRGLLTIVGSTYLAAYGQDVQGLVVGIVPIAVSVIWALWRNVDNKLDMLSSGLRQIIYIASGFAVGKGWVTDQTAQYIAGVVLYVCTQVISQMFYRDAPGPILAGTTIVDPPKPIG
jgi:hypothetical protein